MLCPQIDPKMTNWPFWKSCVKLWYFFNPKKWQPCPSTSLTCKGWPFFKTGTGLFWLQKLLCPAKFVEEQQDVVGWLTYTQFYQLCQFLIKNLQNLKNSNFSKMWHFSIKQFWPFLNRLVGNTGYRHPLCFC